MSWLICVICSSLLFDPTKAMNAVCNTTRPFATKHFVSFVLQYILKQKQITLHHIYIEELLLSNRTMNSLTSMLNKGNRN